MHKSLKQSNSSENSPSPLLYRRQIPKILQTITPSFPPPSLLEPFQATGEGGGDVLEYVYANFPQLESQELRSIGMCGKNLMERATPDFFLFFFFFGFRHRCQLSCLRIGLTKHRAEGSREEKLTVCIHTDEDWSPGDLFQFNQGEAVRRSV